MTEPRRRDSYVEDASQTTISTDDEGGLVITAAPTYPNPDSDLTIYRDAAGQLNLSAGCGEYAWTLSAEHEAQLLAYIRQGPSHRNGTTSR